RYRREHGRTGHLIVSSVEHSAVLAVAEHLQHTQGWQVSVLPVTSEGVVSPDTLAQAIRPNTALVSIMHGNNEIGTLQPIEALGQICRSKGVYFHTDAVQTLGKLPLDLSCLPVDYVTGSAHKIYGPKGIGLLWVHPEAVTPDPLFFGGSQQGGLRPGTENVAAVIGFCQAFELCCQRMRLETPRLHTLQDRLMSAIEALFPNQVVINGPLSPQSRVPGNVHLSIVTDSSNPLGKRPQTPSNIGESLVLKLDLKGFALASGSACHSGALTPSHVVLALGKSEALARATLRISMGQSTSEDDVDRLISALAEVLAS
ncbi:MAG: cysteine desulfurase family protein, partial [Vampirovibrionales bacterium]|nr:cysteine desulfurase family protein [Vampirovibrionales bacterium]